MSFEFSLLPVLGGYWLVTTLHWTKNEALRRSGYHIAFLSASAGFGLLVAAFVLVWLFRSFIPLPLSHFELAAILSVILGFVTPFGLNRIFTQEAAEKRALREHGDLMERLIAEAIDRRKLIEVTMKSRKSYIGFALANKIARWPDSHLSLLPVSSGFREQETLRLVITTNYAHAIQEHINSRETARDEVKDFVSEFRVVVPMTEIVSVRFFDAELHQRFEAAASGPG